MNGRDIDLREACLRALCVCKHSKDVRVLNTWNFREKIVWLVEYHKDAPEGYWNDAGMMELLNLCRVAYRDQLPAPFAPTEPISNHAGTLLHGRSARGILFPQHADEFVTWRGDYRPFTYHLEEVA